MFYCCRSEGDSENIISVNCLKITFESELQLTMYRHWSLFESLCHSDYTFCKFKMWSLKGKKRLHEFLADMGSVKRFYSFSFSWVLVRYSGHPTGTFGTVFSLGVSLINNCIFGTLWWVISPTLDLAAMHICDVGGGVVPSVYGVKPFGVIYMNKSSGSHSNGRVGSYISSVIHTR